MLYRTNRVGMLISESTALRSMRASPGVHDLFSLKSERISYLLGSENATAYHKIYLRVLKGWLSLSKSFISTVWLKSLGVLSDHRKFRIIARFKVIITEMAKSLRGLVDSALILSSTNPMARPAQLQLGRQKRSAWSEICISHKKYSAISFLCLYPFANKNLQQQNIQRGSKLRLQEKKRKGKSPGNTTQFFLKYQKQNKTKLNLRDILICLKPRGFKLVPI